MISDVLKDERVVEAMKRVAEEQGAKETVEALLQMLNEDAELIDELVEAWRKGEPVMVLKPGERQ